VHWFRNIKSVVWQTEPPVTVGWKPRTPGRWPGPH
jgi:hypothetical protein